MAQTKLQKSRKPVAACGAFVLGVLSNRYSAEIGPVLGQSLCILCILIGIFLIATWEPFIGYVWRPKRKGWQSVLTIAMASILGAAIFGGFAWWLQRHYARVTQPAGKPTADAAHRATQAHARNGASEEPIQSLNIRIGRPDSIGWPENGSVPELFGGVEFVTDIINLSPNTPVILDFILVFQFSGDPILFLDQPLPKNRYWKEPNVHKVGTTRPGIWQGLRIEPLGNVAVYIQVDIPKSARMEVHHEILLLVQDRISMKRTGVSLGIPWSDHVFLTNVLRTGSLFKPSLGQMSR